MAMVKVCVQLMHEILIVSLYGHVQGVYVDDNNNNNRFIFVLRVHVHAIEQ